ncbi:MAG: dephospho-CoA kinase [Hormoscilla sp. GM7CHS1pb]|nr:dephospho-CoA kinase [Hormoscilla sp. GM7CHS1pb]
MKRIIGLTGGISTGKTTVSNYLKNVYKLPVLDADVYARDAVQPGSPVLDKITARYGSNILLFDGTLDRPQLGEIIFRNPSERRWLEDIIHPEVRDRFLAAIHQLSETIVLVVPLLFEAQMTDLVTEIWVVSCDRQQQIDRLMQRNSLSLEQAQARINAQMSIEEKCQQADIILDNSSSREMLLRQVDAAFLRHLRTAPDMRDARPTQQRSRSPQ